MHPNNHFPRRVLKQPRGERVAAMRRRVRGLFFPPSIFNMGTKMFANKTRICELAMQSCSAFCDYSTAFISSQHPQNAITHLRGGGSDPSSGPRRLVRTPVAVHLLPSEKVGNVAGRERARECSPETPCGSSMLKPGDSFAGGGDRSKPHS